jgi:hypothetical protein
MLKAIGIQSYYVLVNSERGVVHDQPSPEQVFDHMILAIRLPPDAAGGPLESVQEDPSLGRILYFDSTDPFTPLGRLSANLQGSYALVVSAGGSRLLRLPQQAPESTGVQRAGKWALDDSGKLSGEVRETLLGDRADQERAQLQDLASDADRPKLLDRKLAGSLASYELTHAAIGGIADRRGPVTWVYAFDAQRYAQSAGELLLVRPAVLAVRSKLPISTDRPRHNPVNLLRGRDSDDFEIQLPAGYRVDELPRPVDVEEDFASYHSRTSVKDGVLHYSRRLEIKSFEVPPEQLQKLWRFYTAIDADQRSVATLTLGAPARSAPAVPQPPRTDAQPRQ